MFQYTPEYFRNTYPDWKRKKDSILVRYVHRRLSFYASSFFCRLDITANTVSQLSLGVALIASACYLIHCQIAYIIGAVLLNIWMIMDCADGNIARSVKKEKYGEFVDATSSYILLGIVFICMSIAAYQNNGMLFSAGNVWVVFLGAIAANSDTMGRLLYQKFFNVDAKESKETVPENIENQPSISRLKTIEDRIDKAVGLNGIFLIFVLIVSFMGWFDVFIVFYAVYNALKFIASVFYFLKKAHDANVYV